MDRTSHRVVIFSENVARYLLRGESYLSRSGFILLAGADGRYILDLAARERPVAAILGFDLGDLRADEVCRRMKRTIDPPPAVLIIAPDRSADAEAGCDDVVFPPAVPRALLTRLGPHLHLHHRIQPRRRLVLPVSYGRLIREFLGYTCDLSEGGALIETVLKPRPGRRLLLRLYVDARQALLLPSLVLRCQISSHPGQNLLGVQFLGLAPSQLARLRDCLTLRS